MRTRRIAIERRGEQHTRLPGYAQERAGVVEIVHPPMILPDANVSGEERVEHLYAVRFAADRAVARRRAGRDRLRRSVRELPRARGGMTMAGAADDMALRMRAIESLLIERGVISEAAVDRIASAYEHDIGPLRGARRRARVERP